MGEVSTSKPKSLRGNAFWSSAKTIWTTIVTFFVTPFLISHIGTADYGLYVLLLSVTAFLGVFTFNLGEATLRYVAYYYGRNDMEGINRVFGSTLLIYSVSGGIVCFAFFTASPWLVTFIAMPPEDYGPAATLLRVAALAFGVRIIMSTYGSVTMALQRYDINTKVMILQSVLQFSGTIVIILAGHGLYGLFLWILATYIVTTAIHIAVARRLIPKLRLLPSLDLRGLKEVFGYGIYSWLSMILNLIWEHTDRLLLGSLVGTASVAYLSVPKSIAFRITLAVQNAGAVLFPKFSAMEDRAKMEKLFLDSTWLLLGCTLVPFVPVTVLMPDFLRLWINPEFAARGAWVGQVIAVSCMVQGATLPYEYLVRGLGKPKIITVIYAISSLSSLTVNILLIPRLGIDGAGYCYLVSALIGLGGIVYTWRRVLAMPSSRPLLRPVALPLATGFAVLLFLAWFRSNLAPPGWMGMFVLGGAFTLVAGTALVLVDLAGGREGCRVPILRELLSGILPFHASRG